MDDVFINEFTTVGSVFVCVFTLFNLHHVVMKLKSITILLMKTTQRLYINCSVSQM